MNNQIELNTLELRGTVISLCRGTHHKQHKGIVKSIVKHINKTLPTTRKIEAPKSARSVTVDGNCIVKFHDVDALNIIGFFAIHLYMRKNKCFYSDYQLLNPKLVSQRLQKKAIKMIAGATYKLNHGASFLRCGEYAINAYKNHITNERVTIARIDDLGNGLSLSGDIVIEKDHLKLFSLIGY
jgi:hypothetical protein